MKSVLIHRAFILINCVYFVDFVYLVYLVYFVDLIYFVYLVYFVDFVGFSVDIVPTVVYF
jgi:hypothetical protein